MGDEQRGGDRRDGNDASYGGPERRIAERRATKPPVTDTDSTGSDVPPGEDGPKHDQ